MLENTVNNILNTRKEKKLKQIQQRLEQMSQKWFDDMWQKTFKIMEYYYKKSDEMARHKIAVLEMERLDEIYKGYKNILQQAEANENFDVFFALDELKKVVAEYDEELKKWRKELHRYEGSEKYYMRG